VIAAAERAARPASHAIELRISAEDPARVFAPAPGPITRWQMPSGPGIRVDTAVEAGDRIPSDYDPLIAKLIAHGADRPAALARLRRALAETEVGGIQTTLPFHRAMLAEPGFVGASELSTTWVDTHWDGPRARSTAVRVAALAGGLAALTGDPQPAGGTAPSAGAIAEEAGGDGSGRGWRSGGRDQAVDRWPA
jgi:acetyl-CoA/propionyl-CoA carboxylase biotin carboxyl carrier protein